jgi:hypothetical protein
MFKDGRQKINKIRNIDLDAAYLAAVTSPSVEAQIIDLNQKQLYEKGIESDGTRIGDYAQSTIYRKEKYGDAVSGIPGETGHITLNDTGKFYNSMKIEVKGPAIVITGDMEKANDDIEPIYPKALGLTEESILELVPEVGERMLVNIKSQL